MHFDIVFLIFIFFQKIGDLKNLSGRGRKKKNCSIWNRYGKAKGRIPSITRTSKRLVKNAAKRVNASKWKSSRWRKYIKVRANEKRYLGIRVSNEGISRAAKTCWRSQGKKRTLSSGPSFPGGFDAKNREGKERDTKIKHCDNLEHGN